MIVTKLIGGLGNQLFQYAAGRYLAHKHNTELKLVLDNWFETATSPLAYYRLNEFNIQASFASEEEIKSLQVFEESARSSKPADTLFNPKFLELPDNVILSGYWQSEKYFKGVRNVLLEELTLKNPLGKNSAQWKEKILAAECAVSIQVRRGDYMMPWFREEHGSLPLKYYYESINILKKHYPQMTIFVFSDDLNWVKNNFKFDVPVEFVEGCEKSCEELFLMSYCKHNIIANSTFAWWGAWLNQNPGKKVFGPYPWFYNGWMGHDVVSEDWIEMPVDTKENPMINPTLSVIVYVENNFSTIPLTLQSVLSQVFKDYETIVINSGKSADDCSKYCRQYATAHNFTFLKTSYLTEKYAALNMGIECARGDYILFLNGNDFVISNMTLFVSQIVAASFDKYISLEHSVDKYISYEEFTLKYAPNIFCSTMKIEEDVNGTITVNEIRDKKFSVKTDEQFKNLQGVTEISINDRDKLMLLATQQINNHLGTKFFKRSFLNENKIRFNENSMHGGRDSIELKFLTDAFLQTEKISFVPQVFYGRLN